MMRLLLLILLISANCMKMNCDEEASTTENISEVSEKTELLSADPEPLQNKAENIETESEASKASEVDEEIPVLRSSSNRSKRNETQYDESSKVDGIEISGTEKSGPDKVVKDKEPKSRSNSTEAEDGTKSADIIEKQLEELSKTSASEAEDEKAGDLLEASAESKLSDNENASSYVNESDRNFESENVNEKSDESGLTEGLQTRRMLSINNVVIDTKMRADTTSNEVPPEEKTALKQNINTYNNYNEFGSNSRNKLVNSSPTEPSATTTVPIIPKSAPQEIFNQQYIPRYYPRPELTINFPNVNSDFQGPRDLPIYLKVKQDEAQLRNQLKEAQNSQIKSTEENSYFNPRNQQEYHESQRMPNFPGKITNKEFEDSGGETRNQVPRFYQNKLSTNFDNQHEINKQLTRLNQYSMNQVQKSYQNQAMVNNDYRHLENTIRDARPQVQEKANSKMFFNNNIQGNEYPLYRPPQGMIDSKINLENNQFGTKRLSNPHPYLQPPRPPQIKLLNSPTRIEVIPKQIQFLFQKLASASEYPKKFPTMYLNNNIQQYPYLINRKHRGDSSFYDLSYMPGFQRPI